MCGVTGVIISARNSVWISELELFWDTGRENANGTKSFDKMRNVRGYRERLTAYLSVLPRTSFGVFFPRSSRGRQQGRSYRNSGQQVYPGTDTIAFE